MKKYTGLWDGIKNETETLNGVQEGEYGNDSTKVKFDVDDNLPLIKLLKLHILTIAVRSVFEKDGKYYPQIYLNEYLYEL